MRIVLMVSLIVASIAVRSAQAAESETGSALPQTQRVTLKWLGTAGWEIQFAQTKILIDPFLTRKQPVAGEEWKTDEEAVLNVIGGGDYIFAGHSHAPRAPPAFRRLRVPAARHSPKAKSQKGAK